MTVAIFALDGLDIEYVQQRGLLSSLEPSELENDLEGANALFTYRIWPSIFAGIDGGASDEPYSKYKPEQPYIWEQYAATVLLAPTGRPPTLQYQNAFPEGYVESVGPDERTDEKFDMYREGIEAALDRDAELLVVGSKLPDILGHNEHHAGRIHDHIERLCDLAESVCNRDEVDDYLVVSDHGFEYEDFGDEPSGLDAHRPSATLASSFADYDSMHSFIEEWHSDLESALREKRLNDLGYK